MTKADLIANVAKKAKISKAAAEKAINALTNSVTKALKKGDMRLTPDWIWNFLRGEEEGENRKESTNRKGD